MPGDNGFANAGLPQLGSSVFVRMLVALAEEFVRNEQSSPRPMPVLAPVLIQQSDHLLTRPVQVYAQARQHLRGYAVALSDEAEQDVLGDDILVAELDGFGFIQRQLQHLLRLRGEWNVPGRRLHTPAGDLLHPLPHGVEADAHSLQRLGRNAADTLMGQAEQEVLSADVVVIERPGLALCLDHNPPGPVSEPLEHAPPPFAIIFALPAAIRLCPAAAHPGGLAAARTLPQMIAYLASDAAARSEDLRD